MLENEHRKGMQERNTGKGIQVINANRRDQTKIFLVSNATKKKL